MGTRRGHVPIRSCVVCGARNPKDALLRMALDPETRCIVLDTGRQLPGRGAYACRGCLPRLQFTRKVRKAFRDKAEGLLNETLSDD